MTPSPGAVPDVVWRHGNIADVFKFTIKDSTGQLVDLTGLTIRCLFRLWDAPDAETINLQGAIDGTPTNGNGKLTFAATDFTQLQPGDYDLIIMTLDNGTPVVATRYPSNGRLSWFRCERGL